MKHPKTFLSPVLIVLTWASACASGDFASSHFVELQKDCSETLRCKSSSLEASSANTEQGCVDAAGERLQDSTPTRQQNFLDSVNRCTALVSCDYVSCTQSDPTMGYAALHDQIINYGCQQHVACNISLGQTLPNTAVADCVSQTSNQLNFATNQMQTAFEQKCQRCATQTACAWVNCQ